MALLAIGYTTLWYCQGGKRELTGVRIAREVYRGVHVSGKHLSGNKKARIVAFFAIPNMEVLRCLPTC